MIMHLKKEKDETALACKDEMAAVTYYYYFFYVPSFCAGHVGIAAANEVLVVWGSHYLPSCLIIIWIKPGGGCCRPHLKREDAQEVSTSPAVANEISVDAAELAAALVFPK